MATNTVVGRTAIQSCQCCQSIRPGNQMCSMHSNKEQLAIAIPVNTCMQAQGTLRHTHQPCAKCQAHNCTAPVSLAYPHTKPHILLLVAHTTNPVSELAINVAALRLAIPPPAHSPAHLRNTYTYTKTFKHRTLGTKRHEKANAALPS